MFSAEEIQGRLREQPFAPFQIVTTTGQTYDVRHPDLVFVTRRYLMVGTPAPESPTISEQATRIAIIHVTELRDLPATSFVPPSDDSEE